MVSIRRRPRLKLPAATLPAAPMAGLLCAVLMAAIFALMPVSTLESLIMRSGIAAIVAAAEPPLGSTARILLILIGGGFIGLITWFALFLTIGSRTVSITPAGAKADAAAPMSDIPVLRRADAHPDAPARAPLFANRDLGTPFLEVRALDLAAGAMTEAEEAALEPLPGTPTPQPIVKPRISVLEAQPLPIARAPLSVPRVLDQPLAAFDPGAIRDTPMAPPAPPPPSLASAPRPQIIDPGERFETFELTPMVRGDQAKAPQAPPPLRTPLDTQATLAALLERLERGVSRRGDQPASHGEGLEQALGELRQMATRG